MLTVVILDNSEKFIDFLDPDLIELSETHSTYGLRCLELNYRIDSFEEAQELFKSGHKIWVQGDNSLTDCLYVINSNIEKDLFLENQVNLTAEEVLVELNYAPPFSQTELTGNGFTIKKVNSEDNVKVNYYFLNYWFGKYFQIGVVQDCISQYASRIAPTGVMPLMELLRFIEDETGNVFRTRYEKDVKTNVIHRYLDFLNPNSADKNWELYIDYNIPEDDDGTGDILDANGDTICGHEPFDTDDEMDGVEDDDDIVKFPVTKEKTYYDPEDLTFRMTNDKGTVLGSWNGDDIGVTAQANLILMAYDQSKGLSCQCNGKTFLDIKSTNPIDTPEIYSDFSDESNPPFVDIDDDPNKVEVILGNRSLFQVLAGTTVIYQQSIYPLLGDVHEEVLDLGFNIENIKVDVDESDTFNAIAPMLSVDDNNSSDSLSKKDMDNIINAWINLSVTKGTLIPMIIQRVTTTSTKTTGNPNDYYSKPIKANDNTSTTPPSYEYWAATAYRKAPFNKNAGELYVYDDTTTGVEYTHIKARPDMNENLGDTFTPKIGQVETSEEDKYAIYNAVASKLQEKKYPKVEVDVEVVNYKNRKFNDYQLWDKVYLKIPGYTELITARVDSISKNSNDIAKNTVHLANYSINNLTPQKPTVLYGDNVNFKYPKKGKLVVTLKDEDDNILANKLITVSITGDAYVGKPSINLKTNSNGQITLTMGWLPGQYTVTTYYGGDEIYEPSTATFDVSVGGEVAKEKTTSKKKKSVKKTTKKKTTKKSNKTVKKVKKTSKVKYKTVKTYWSKCGKSPDKTKVIGIGHYSASNSDAKKYGVSYRNIYRSVFKNKCPSCGKEGTLVFDGGKKTKCVNKKWHSRGYKIDWNYEHGINCTNCDSDYDCVTGLNTATSHPNRLKMLEKPKKSSNTAYKKLISGKLLYSSKKVKIKQKKNNKKTSGRSQPIKSGINKKVKERAFKIVDKKKHLAAAKAIAAWMGSNIRYEQNKSKVNNFSRTPVEVLNAGMGNCCSQTRLMLEMMDAVGVTEKYKLIYIHVSTGTRGHVFARLVNRQSGKGVYIDPCKSNPWGHWVRGYGTIGSCPNSVYPTLPF